MTNLLEYLEILTEAVDKGENVDVLYLDFARAFDKVPIRRLLAKVQGVGISGSLLGWIEEWLRGRQQRVVIKGEASGWREILSGVVQGSALGPLLFLIFINDLDLEISGGGTFVNKFADDTKAGAVVNTEEEAGNFQASISRLVEWARKWQMEFNLGKCHVMHFGKKNRKHQYFMGSHTVTASNREEDLGIQIADNLRPSAQCAAAAKRANSVLGQMSRALSYRDRNTFLSLYKSHVRPHLEYAVQAWAPWTKQDCSILEAVQRRAVNMISGLQGSYEDKLQELSLPTLEARRKRGDQIQVFKVMAGIDEVDSDVWFERMENRGGATSTRATSNALAIKEKNTTSMKEPRLHFWGTRSIQTWNSLPEHARRAGSVNLFKDYYDEWVGTAVGNRTGNNRSNMNHENQ